MENTIISTTLQIVFCVALIAALFVVGQKIVAPFIAQAFTERLTPATKPPRVSL